MSDDRLCIILMSALTTPDPAAVSLAVGADDFVTKPFDIDDLVSRVELALCKLGRLGNTTVPEQAQI